jgi:hypothetical protein
LGDAPAAGEPEGPLAGQSEATLAALASRAGLLVARASLFAAEVMTPERAQADAQAEAAAEAAESHLFAAQRGVRISRRTQPRTGVRRKTSGAAWNAPTMFPSPSASDESSDEGGAAPLTAPEDERHDGQ